MWKIFARNKHSEEDRKLIGAVRNIAGFTPRNLDLYKLATLHSSVSRENDHGFKESNERLEYLGDAILGACVADFLFKRYPFKSEGFLTEIRSRLVNREALNLLGRRLGLGSIIRYDLKNTHLQQVILGNTLEALVGAIYLDKGYHVTRRFVINKLIVPHYDIEELINSNSNFKSKIIEWAQREGHDVKFEIVDVKKGRNHKEFIAQVLVNNEAKGTGHGNSKKKAEQDAAQKTCVMLEIET